MSNTELDQMLEYIANSPPQEYGGFHHYVVDAAKAAIAELARLREARQEINKVNDLKAALEDLVDCQNWSPLPKYAKDWNAAMAQAYHLLGREPWVYQE